MNIQTYYNYVLCKVIPKVPDTIVLAWRILDGKYGRKEDRTEREWGLYLRQFLTDASKGHAREEIWEAMARRGLPLTEIQYLQAITEAYMPDGTIYEETK